MKNSNEQHSGVQERRRLVAVFDNIRSLYNVGSMFRTADAFSVKHIYLCGITGTPEHEPQQSRIAKSALGAEGTIPWTYTKQTVDAVRQLKSDGVTVIALEQTSNSIPIQQFTVHNSQYSNDCLALVIGHELFGVSESALALADYIVHIPMMGKKESLNVAVAFGIATAWIRINIC